MNDIGEQAIEAMRLGGVGWIFALFVVGATILAGRLLVNWQMRRLERILGRKPKPEDWDESNSGNNGNPQV